MEEVGYLIALSLLREVGPVTQRALLRTLGSAESVFRASMKELISVDGVGEKRAKAIKGFRGWKKVEEILKRARRQEMAVVGITDEGYPQVLKTLPDSPLVLYKRGEYQDEDRFAVAVVGSRRPSQYGLTVTDIITGGLAEAGLTIVSGLARGIDTQAHKAALVRGGRTIAVLGSGIDVAYPPENLGLMRRIEKSGVVFTEFPPGTKPARENFPIRNRLISGLSLGVVVVEASHDSGALITARYAINQNRDVFAVPGLITSENSRGVNRLLREGAILVESAEDVLRELAPQLKGFIRERRKKEVELTEEERVVVQHLSQEPLHIDILTRRCKFPLNKILSVLTSLELKGVVRQTEGKRFYLV